MGKIDIKKMKCWCEAIDWDKVIEQYPDEARTRDFHNCGKDTITTKLSECYNYKTHRDFDVSKRCPECGDFSCCYFLHIEDC